MDKQEVKEKHPCKDCVYYRKYKNGKTECKLSDTEHIDLRHGFCFSKRVKNPYWEHAPYNCPYHYIAWNGEERCKMYDYCDLTYGWLPSCDEYEAIYGKQNVTPYERYKIKIELKQKEAER